MEAFRQDPLPCWGRNTNALTIACWFLLNHCFSHSKSWPGPLCRMCRGFLLYILCRILPGIFLEDFLGHFSPQKRGEKIQEQLPRKKSGGSKIKNPRRIRSANTDLNKYYEARNDYADVFETSLCNKRACNLENEFLEYFVFNCSQ